MYMAGHNDVFSIARLCKLKEGTPMPPDLERQIMGAVGGAADAALPSHASKGGGAAPWSLNAFSLILNRTVAPWQGMASNVTSVKAAPSWLKCAARHMLTGTLPAIRDIIATVGARNAGSRPLLLMGVNPTTGFPVMDALMHQAIWWAATESGYAEACEDTSDAPNGLRWRLVSFEGFKRGIDTFDTTHPNGPGAAKLAAAWKAAFDRSVTC